MVLKYSLQALSQFIRNSAFELILEEFVLFVFLNIYDFCDKKCHKSVLVKYKLPHHDPHLFVHLENESYI